MVLKPQDIFILMKLVSVGKGDWSYNSLAVSLYMSPSEVHAAIKRALAAPGCPYGGSGGAQHKQLERVSPPGA